MLPVDGSTSVMFMACKVIAFLTFTGVGVNAQFMRKVKSFYQPNMNIKHGPKHVKSP